MIPCPECDKRFKIADSLRSHRRDHHVLEVYYGENRTLLTKIEGEFHCPACVSEFSSTRTLFSHLSGEHGLSTSYSKKRDLTDSTMAISSDSLEPNIDPASRPPFNTHVPRPPLLMNDRAPEVTGMTTRQTLLAASDGLLADVDAQDDKLMLAKLGRWAPIIYEQDGDQLGLLTTAGNVAKLLDKPATGTWKSPTNDVNTGQATTNSCNSSNLIQHIKINSKLSRALTKTRHQELTKDMADILNEDWLEHPQLRYCTSNLLSGAILVAGGVSIIINTIEPYSRDSLLDAHYERKLSPSSSSFPTTPGPYGYLSVSLLTTPDGQKLVIGTRTCNFLVTGSCRLDNVSVNFGASTSHFLPSEKTKVFLDCDSIRLTKSMLNDSSLTRSQQMPTMYLLKQVRSKFNHLSTYTLCRSFSQIASHLELQPCTIWTLCDQDTNQPTLSQAKVGSLLFRTVAVQVILNGSKGKLDLDALDDIIALANSNSVVATILGKIRSMFGDQQELNIIGNTRLNSQLVDLANNISNKSENDKKINMVISALYD